MLIEYNLFQFLIEQNIIENNFQFRNSILSYRQSAKKSDEICQSKEMKVTHVCFDSIAQCIQN